MRKPVPIVALLTALSVFSPGAFAQTQQSQPVPDAPQPQKKTSPSPVDHTGVQSVPVDPADQPRDNAKPSTAADNPFPEDQSRNAAKSADQPKPSTAKDNPFPEDQSRNAAKSADQPKSSTAKDNPFPEDVSRDAAKAAGGNPAPKSDVPAGVSSSQSSSSPGDAEDDVVDPSRAKKDIEVGGFYLKNGDLQGALLRYQEATKVDPTNVDAIFGLAEAQRMLKKNTDAARNYQLYLDIVPNGPKAKQALKALKTLPPG